jgi:hypothetical protein
MLPTQRVTAIYKSDGSIAAYLVYPYIYDLEGAWIGWVARNRQVYTVHGTYTGWLSDEPRILRRNSTAHIKPRLTPPPAPGKFTPPEIDQEPPQMANLRGGTFDVLDRAPDLMPAFSLVRTQNTID